MHEHVQHTRDTFLCSFSGSVDSWSYQEEPSQFHRWRRVYGVKRG